MLLRIVTLGRDVDIVTDRQLHQAGPGAALQREVGPDHREVSAGGSVRLKRPN